MDRLELLGPVDRRLRARVGDERLVSTAGPLVHLLARPHGEQVR